MKISSRSLPPRKLFLIDSAGALLTAVLTGLVLPKVEPAIGLPLTVLHSLGVVAIIFAIYSFLNFYFFGSKSHKHFAVIAIANAIYCVVALAFVLYFHESVTHLGMAYFMLETVVVFVLVRVQWQASGVSAIS